METKRFVIYGEPKGKQRPKFSTINGHARAITPEQTVNFENLVRMEYHAQLGDFIIESGTPVYVLIDAFQSIPKGVSNRKRQLMIRGELRPMKKPDFDNLGKIICDSLNKIAYYDDSAVVDGRVRKFYGIKPRIEVFISTQEIDHHQIDEWRRSHYDE